MPRYTLVRPLGRLSALLAGALLVTLHAGPAAATPVQYDFVSGTASLEVNINGFIVGGISTPLSGTSFTFDQMVPEVTGINYLIADDIWLDSSLGWLQFSVTIVDDTGFSAPAVDNGGGSYSYAGGPLLLSADVSFSGGSLGSWSDTFQLTIDPVDGTVDIAGNTATVLTQKDLWFSCVPFVGKNVTLSASVDFLGVPEPGLALLLLLGGGALGMRARRRAA